MPFVKVGGHFLAYKSLKTKTELDEAQNALKLMKSELVDIVAFELPNNFGTREIMIIQKNGKIDKKYPRKAGTPKKSPL
jgi:16S rRNA (guanine527-N7)-methyltransferase